jgi:hypothetical protein
VTAIEVFGSIVIAAAALAAVLTLVVIAGIHQEEKRWTFSDGTPPTALARTARRVLGAYCDSPWTQAQEELNRRDQHAVGTGSPAGV